MIRQLNIENLIIIDRLDIHFRSGLSVITGETGVGKSIIVNAVSLALGGRGKPQWLKPGCQRLSVTLDCDAGNNPAVSAWLAEHQLEQATGDCIVRRTMDKNGRSRAYINSLPVTVSQLKSLGQQLLDISGQNQHQSLVHSEQQLFILDARCQHQERIVAMQAACKRYREAQAQLQALESQEQETAAKREWLLYQYEEIKNLAAQSGEYEAIDKEHRLLSQKEVLLQTLQEAHRQLWDNPASDDIYAQLNKLQQQIEKHKTLNSHLASASTQLEEASILIKQTVDDIRHCLNAVELSEQRIQELDERLSAYNELARKYKLAPEELAAKQIELQEQLGDSAVLEKEIEQWRQRMNQAGEEYRQLADQVSSKRQADAQLLSEEVVALLSKLGMADSQLQIACHDRRQQGPREQGHEDIEFLVRTNRGQNYGSIAAIASGGELSRISLAMQLAMHSQQTVGSFLFDEVDAGIGGQVAKLMGQLLKKLSRRSQLICITHLPSIAVQGDQHYVLTKKQTKSGTQVDIALLSEEERCYEIARMMVGSRITKQSLIHAQSMLASRG